MHLPEITHTVLLLASSSVQELLFITHEIQLPKPLKSYNLSLLTETNTQKSNDKSKNSFARRKDGFNAAKKAFGGKIYKQCSIKIQSQVTRAESCGQVTLHFHSKQVQNNVMERDMNLHAFLSMPKLLSASLDT